MSGSERKADLKSVATEIQFANVCFRAVTGPRSVTCLMSTSSHKLTSRSAPPITGAASYSPTSMPARSQPSGKQLEEEYQTANNHDQTPSATKAQTQIPSSLDA